ALILGSLLWTAAATAEAVLLGPGHDLAGVVEQRHDSPVTLQQMSPQAHPFAASGQRSRFGQLQHTHRLTPPVAKSMLGYALQPLRAYPGTRKQRTAISLHKALRPLQQNPAFPLAGRDAGGSPIHQ